MSDLCGRARCLGVSSAHCTCLTHWTVQYYSTVTAQWLDHVAPWRVGDSRTEARPVCYLYISVTHKTASTDIVARAGEIVRSYRSKFKLVSHQFSTVQFPRHQFVWKVRSVQFAAPGPSASVQFIQFSSRTLPALILRLVFTIAVRAFRSTEKFWWLF